MPDDPRLDMLATATGDPSTLQLQKITDIEQRLRQVPQPLPGSSGGGTSPFIPKTLIDAKGDLLVGTGDDSITRIAVDSDNGILQSDSTGPAGVSWTKTPSLTKLTLTGSAGSSALEVSTTGDASPRFQVKTDGTVTIIGDLGVQGGINGSVNFMKYTGPNGPLGTVDCSAAFTTACADLAGTGKELYIPAGDWRFDAAGTSAGASGIRVRGAGRNTRLFAPRDHTNSGSILNFNASSYCEVRDLQIDANWSLVTKSFTAASSRDVWLINVYGRRNTRENQMFLINGTGGGYLDCYVEQGDRDVFLLAGDGGVCVRNTVVGEPDPPTTTLQTAINATVDDTAITVTDASVLPGVGGQGGWFAWIDGETVLITSVNVATNTLHIGDAVNVGRGRLGTPAAAHAVGATITMRPRGDDQVSSNGGLQNGLIALNVFDNPGLSRGRNIWLRRPQNVTVASNVLKYGYQAAIIVQDSNLAPCENVSIIGNTGGYVSYSAGASGLGYLVWLLVNTTGSMGMQRIRLKGNTLQHASSHGLMVDHQVVAGASITDLSVDDSYFCDTTLVRSDGSGATVADGTGYAINCVNPVGPVELSIQGGTYTGFPAPSLAGEAAGTNQVNVQGANVQNFAGRSKGNLLYPTALGGTGALTPVVTALSAGVGQNIALNSGGAARGWVFGGTYTVAANTNGTPFLSFLHNPVVNFTAGASRHNTPVAFRAGGQYNVASGVAIPSLLGTYVGLETNPTYVAIPGSGSATVSGFRGLNITATIDTGWTFTLYQGVRVALPAGAGAIGTLVGIDLDDFTGRATTNISLRSIGAAEMQHAGALKLGATGSPAAGVVLDVTGATTITGSFGLLISTSITSSVTAATIASGQTVTLGTSGRLNSYGLAGTFNVATNTSSVQFLTFSHGPTVNFTNAAARHNSQVPFRAAGVMTTSAAIPNLAGTYSAYEVTPSYSATGGGTASATELRGLFFQPTIDTGWTFPTVRGVHIRVPLGVGTITTLVALEVEDFAGRAGTDNVSLRSSGTGVEMRHAGSVKIGATGAPGAGLALDVTGDTTLRGALSVTGGIKPYTGTVLSSGYVAHHWPGATTSGVDHVPVAGTIQYAQVDVRFTQTFTGIGILVGSVGGTDSWIVALCDSTGAPVATSALAGTTAGAAAGWQEIPFTAALTAKGPGRYYIALQSNGTTARFRTWSTGITARMAVGSQTGTFGTIAAITPPTSFTSDVGPIGYLY